MNFYPTTIESELDQFFWQYFEIPLGINGLSLNKKNKQTKQTVNKKNIPIAEPLFKLVIKVATQLCKNAVL